MVYRIRDIVLSFLGLLLLSPFLCVVMLLLKVRYGRVFFTQTRPGRNEKPFEILKFSKMYEGKEPLTLTPMGRWMQSFSIDEIPQLINVLKGDMSLVGPRPLLMEYLPLYSFEEKRRHTVMPGLTGWAQVNGRNALSFKDKFKLDIWYVHNRSHLLDIKIMWMTVLKVLRREGNTFLAEKYDGRN